MSTSLAAILTVACALSTSAFAAATPTEREQQAVDAATTVAASPGDLLLRQLITGTARCCARRARATVIVPHRKSIYLCRIIR